MEEPSAPSSEDEDTTVPSKVYSVLTASRTALWNARFPSVLRSYVVDPWIQVTCIWLPPTAQYFHSDGWISVYLHYTLYKPLQLLQKKPSLELRDVASQQLLYTSSPLTAMGGPPTDTRSALQGGFAFFLSVLADLVGAMGNPEKIRKWYQTLGALRTYLHQSGVGAELEEAMLKPLWRGRLLDNLKILNDWQEQRSPNLTKRTTSEHGLLQQASHWMRFATAAYGTAMVQSAVDRDYSHTDLETDAEAIAFHTQIQKQHILHRYTAQGGSMKILRHFVALDTKQKAVVLAIRGTLSISGALVDLQAMDCGFCGGRAHQGIAEQATHIWEVSGERIQTILKKYPDYKLLITGHSLGAGAACLLQLKIYYEQLLSTTDRCVECFGFAPPPTFCWTNDSKPMAPSLQQALDRCYAFVHDNDCVPLLSVASIRRLADLMDTVDNQTELYWFWRRFRIFWEWEGTPTEIVKALDETRPKPKNCLRLEIAAGRVFWMKKTFTGNFEMYPCTPQDMAQLDIFVCQDMASDHLPEQYEDALDALLLQENQSKQ